MSGFVLGVLSSLVATGLTVLAGWIGSRRIRRWTMLLLSRATGLGIDRVYAQQRAANADLATDLSQAKWVRVLAGRGNELTRASFQQLWHGANTKLEFVQILLPEPDPGPGSWLTERALEIRRHDPGFSADLLADQVQSNIQYLDAVANQRKEVSLRLYDLPHLGRIVITDRVAYVTLYSAGGHGRNSMCLVFTCPSPTYDFAVRIFTTAWNRATPVTASSAHVNHV